jgi:hypothetical protein
MHQRQTAHHQVDMVVRQRQLMEVGLVKLARGHLPPCVFQHRG